MGRKQEPSLKDLGLDVLEERTNLGWITTWQIQKGGRRPGADLPMELYP